MWSRAKLFSSAVLLTAVLFIGSPSAQTGTTVRFSWNPPTTGSPVEQYNLSVMSDSTSVPNVVGTTSLLWINYSMPTGIRYVRVQAQDAFDRVGPWSHALIWNDAGAPGGCSGLKWIKI